MSIQQKRFIDLAEQLGFNVEKQAAFIKIPMGDKAVYVADTQKVTRVDVAGFSFSHPALVQLTQEQAKEMKLGRVRGQLDFTKGEEAVMEAFATALATMKFLAGASIKELGKHGKLVRSVKESVEIVGPRRKGPRPEAAAA